MMVILKLHEGGLRLLSPVGGRGRANEGILRMMMMLGEPRGRRRGCYGEASGVWDCVGLLCEIGFVAGEVAVCGGKRVPTMTSKLCFRFLETGFVFGGYGLSGLVV